MVHFHFKLNVLKKKKTGRQEKGFRKHIHEMEVYDDTCEKSYSISSRASQSYKQIINTSREDLYALKLFMSFEPWSEGKTEKKSVGLCLEKE